MLIHRQLSRMATAFLVAMITLAAAAPAGAALETVVDGTTLFPDSNAATEMECSDQAAQVSCGADFVGSLHCNLCLTDVSTSKLETATALISQAGLARKRRTATSLLRHEFSVPLGDAPYVNEDIVLAANVGVSYAIQGMMAAAGEASAEVEVVLTVTDQETGSVAAVRTLYENDVVAGVDPQATIGAGVLLPNPDGEGGVDLGFEVGTEPTEMPSW